MLPNHQAHLLRVMGRAAWSKGRKNLARTRFDKAVERSRRKKMNYQLAKSLLDRAAIGAANAVEDRREAIDLLRSTESVIPRAEAWLLAEDLDPSLLAAKLDLTSLPPAD